MRKLLFLTSAIVCVDTLFYSVLTPLLPRLAHSAELGKTGAGVLAAAYPAGALVSALPSGIVAARFGVKRTVIVGMTVVAACTAAFGVAGAAWQLDLARFAQGAASSFSWTGALAWLVAGSPLERRGTMIGSAFAAAVSGALFGPVVGGVASLVGLAPTFGPVAAASLGLVAWAALTRVERPDEPQPVGVLARALSDPAMLGGVWLVVLPSLLFGTLNVLAPLRLAALGFGAVAIGAVFLCAAAAEAVNNVVVGRASDRRGPLSPARVGLAASAIVALVLPWPEHRLLLAPLVVVGGVAFGTLFTPAMTFLAHRAEGRGLDHGYTFALVTLAWAPGQTVGSAGGAALAHATSDAVPYLLLAGVCSLTLFALWRLRASTGSTTPSDMASSASSSRITAAG